MNKSRSLKLTALFLTLLMLAGVFIVPVSAADTDSGVASVTKKTIKEVSETLNAITYEEYNKKYSDVPRATKEVTVEAADYIPEKTTAEVSVESNYEGKSGNSLVISETGTVAWAVNVPETGRYAIEIEYYPIISKTNSIERMFYINGKVPFQEARYLQMSKVWIHKYTTKEDGTLGFITDINGNDIRPTTEDAPVWRSYVFIDSNGYYANPFEFVFEKGENTIALEAVREPVAIRSIRLFPYKDLPTYEEYRTQNSGSTANAEPVKINAETPTAVSHMTVYPIYDRTSAITDPQDPTLIKLNTIGSEKWQTSGQWVRYNFTVPADGYYQIVPRFRQADLNGLFVSRKLRIDGEVPFQEANNLRFDYSTDWQAKPLNDGYTEFEFYLTAGEHEIELECTLGDMGTIIRQVKDTLKVINEAYLSILKLTGASPDAYRDYGFSRVMPNTIKSILIESRNLENILETLQNMNGIKGSNITTLEQISILLEKMGTDEDEVAKNLGNLKSYIGSLGTWVNTVNKQPLEIDFIMVQPSTAKLPKANANFFQSIAYQFNQFIGSFFADYNSIGSTVETTTDNQIDVWVVTGRDQAQVIRNQIDNKFTPETGIGVNLKLVAGGTLLPSVLAGVGPDVSLSEADPINYAIRSAVLPLNGFDTFKEVRSRFSKAAFIPVTLYDVGEDPNDENAGTTYALPETQTFPMLFYRKDILADLGLEIPKTWDDLLEMIPVLQYNNMEIGLSTDYNIFLYQMGGSLYTDYGMRINLDSNTALDAFQKMCNMFTAYSLPYTYDFANRFRTGEMPVAVAAYTAYQQLSVFATEIAGLWEFVPLPGIEDEDGNINNCSVAGISSIVMMSGCDNQEAAWDFMDWYVDKDYQATYANEIVGILGTAGMHPTANIEALAELPWTATEYENLMAQFNNLAAIPNYPGNYIIGRYTNFAFLAAYNEKADPVDSLLNYINTINKELTRKRTEFGFATLELGQTLDDVLAETGQTLEEYVAANQKKK